MGAGAALSVRVRDAELATGPDPPMVGRLSKANGTILLSAGPVKGRRRAPRLPGFRPPANGGRRPTFRQRTGARFAGRRWLARAARLLYGRVGNGCPGAHLRGR